MVIPASKVSGSSPASAAKKSRSRTARSADFRSKLQSELRSKLAANAADLDQETAIIEATSPRRASPTSPRMFSCDVHKPAGSNMMLPFCCLTRIAGTFWQTVCFFSLCVQVVKQLDLTLLLTVTVTVTVTVARLKPRARLLCVERKSRLSWSGSSRYVSLLHNVEFG